MKKLPTFTLPPGWSFLPPGVEQSLIPGAPDGYGGATFSRQTDGAGILFVGFNGTPPGDIFQWCAFRWNRDGTWSRVILQRVNTGRGQIFYDRYYERLTWGAFTGPKWDTDWLPDAAPFTPAGLTPAQLAALAWVGKLQTAVQAITKTLAALGA